MKWAPLGFFLLGYWCMGNKQMFNNSTVSIVYKNDPIPTEHNGLPWNEDGPALVMFFFLVVYLIFACFLQNFVIYAKEKGWMSSEFEDIDVDEDLGNYFECIPNEHRKEWLTMETYNRNVLGVSTFGIGTLEEMRTTVGKGKTLTSIPTYNILSNPSYQTRFGFTPMQYRD